MTGEGTRPAGPKPTLAEIGHCGEETKPELATKEDIAAVNHRLDEVVRLLTAVHLKQRIRHRHGPASDSMQAAFIQILNDISAEFEMDLGGIEGGLYG